MPKPSYDVSKHGEHSKGIYWQLGSTDIHVLESFNYKHPRYRLCCMTCLLNECQHVDALKHYLDHFASEAAA